MSSIQQWSAAVTAVVDLLKTRFPNLTTSETVKLATELVEAVLKAHA